MTLGEALRRLSRDGSALAAYLDDRAGWAALRGLGERDAALLLAQIGPSQRERLELCRELRAKAVAQALAARFPHTLARLAEGGTSAELAAELLLARTLDRAPLDQAFAAAVADDPCPWLPDLVRLEEAVACARALRERLGRAYGDGTAAGRITFTLDRRARLPLRRNLALPQIELAHALPFEDFPLHLSSRPPATWPDLLPREPVSLAVLVAPSPPHPLALRALTPTEQRVLALADGRPLDQLLARVADPESAFFAAVDLASLGLVALALDEGA